MVRLLHLGGACAALIAIALTLSACANTFGTRGTYTKAEQERFLAGTGK